MDDIGRSIAILDHIEAVEDEGELERLDQALTALVQASETERAMDALFRIYERFPNADSYDICLGIFWHMLHIIEDMPGYEHRLIESVQRQPMEFNLLMVNRLLNAGITHRAGVDLLALLERVAAGPQYSEAAREEARELAEWQRSRI